LNKRECSPLRIHRLSLIVRCLCCHLPTSLSTLATSFSTLTHDATVALLALGRARVTDVRANSAHLCRIGRVSAHQSDAERADACAIQTELNAFRQVLRPLVYALHRALVAKLHAIQTQANTFFELLISKAGPLTLCGHLISSFQACAHLSAGTVHEGYKWGTK